MRADLRGVLLAGFAAASLAASPASAFSVEGHEALEAAVYRRLIATPSIDDGEGHDIAGADVVRFLIRHGALQAPRCFEPTLITDIKRCNARKRDRPIELWPVIGTGEPDLKSARQFGTNGQCFHFMARTEDVWGSRSGDLVHGVPRRLSEDAYRRCTRVLGQLFANTIQDPPGSNDEYDGFYALLHAVADSFSAAHVERDADWNILYLKPWRLRGYLPYSVPGRWDSFKFLFGSSHHGIVDERDSGFIRDEPGCSIDHPYAVPDRCFTVRGERAIDALRDLVITTYRVLRHAEPGAPPLDATDTWRDFVGRQLRSATVDPDTQPPFWNEREWIPAFLFGFRYRPNPTPNTHDFSFLVGSTVFTDVTLPLTPLLEVEAGCRRVAGLCQLELGVQTSLLIPLTEGFSLGVTPLSIVGAGGDGQTVTIGAHVLRADLFLLDALWLSAAGPKYDSIHRAFDAELFTLSLGFAWNGKGFERSAAPGGLRFAIDSRRSAHEDKTPPVPWVPPPLEGNYQRAPVTVVVHIAGGTILPERDDGSFSVGGVEVLWDRDHYNRRAGFGVGARVDTSYRVAEPDRFFTLIGGPVARLYLVPNRLALEAAPLQFDGGLQRGPVFDDEFLDIGAEGSLAISPLNRLEIGVESPRISYKTGTRVKGTNLALRVGFAIE